MPELPNDMALKHRTVLGLAFTGATRSAIDELIRLELYPAARYSLASGRGLDHGTVVADERCRPDRLRKRRNLVVSKTAKPYEAPTSIQSGPETKMGTIIVFNAATRNLLAGHE